MSFESFVPIIVAILSGGGLAGGVYALLKLRPEAGQIVVTAAQGALVVQAGVIEALVEENNRLRARVTALESRLQELQDEFHNKGSR
jgi:cell division protein FtsB